MYPLESITRTLSVHVGGGLWAQEKLVSVLQASGAKQAQSCLLPQPDRQLRSLNHWRWDSEVIWLVPGLANTGRSGK